MKKNYLSLVLILVISAFLRFYNLMFDAPYFFNPDERNMANAITQLRLPMVKGAIPLCINTELLKGLITYWPPVDPTTCNLNPHFFAYGQFPLYLAFFSDQSVKLLPQFPFLPTTHNSQPITFPQAIFWLRFWSAFSSTLTVLLVFLITRRLFENCKLSSKRGWAFGPKIENLAALLAAFTPGLIQTAHFGTTESLLTFFYLLIIYLSLKLTNAKHYIFLAIALGLAISTKVSALLFFPIPLLAIFLSKLKLLKKFLFSFLILTSSFLILCLTSPYNILDYKSFIGSMNYESAVALGTTKVFYTRQFENTVPVLFQMQKIFPYALGIPIFIFGVSGIGIVLSQLIIRLTCLAGSPRCEAGRQVRNLHRTCCKTSLFFEQVPTLRRDASRSSRLEFTPNAVERLEHNKQNTALIVLLLSFFIYFLPNAFLYAKWTRFMTPVFPLFTVFAALFLSQIHRTKPVLMFRNMVTKKKEKALFILIHYSLFILLLLPGFLFFTLYLRPDTRIQASEWIYQNIPSNSYVLSETANVVDIPVPLSSMIYHPSSTVVSFNFYDLDENPTRFEELLTHFEKADYIFVPSRRIFANSLRLAQKYPLTARYYELLFSGKLGFTQVAEFSSFASPKSASWWTKAGFPIFPDEQSEETFTVFDHPVIRIYKKTKEINSENYRKLFRLPNTVFFE